MKQYTITFAVNGRYEYLTVIDSNKRMAKKTAISLYNGYIKEGIVNNYKFVAIY